jgi:hypothetical protein
MLGKAQLPRGSSVSAELEVDVARRGQRNNPMPVAVRHKKAASWSKGETPSVANCHWQLNRRRGPIPPNYPLIVGVEDENASGSIGKHVSRVP